MSSCDGVPFENAVSPNSPAARWRQARSPGVHGSPWPGVSLRLVKSLAILTDALLAPLVGKMLSVLVSTESTMRFGAEFVPACRSITIPSDYRFPPPFRRSLGGLALGRRSRNGTLRNLA